MKTIKDIAELFRTEYEKDCDEDFAEPAEQSAIDEFAANCRERNVPEHVTEQLTELYKIVNEMFVDGMELHSCDDEILYEWWEEQGELWLGCNSCDVFRWSSEKGKFCIGDASDTSYDEDHEFDTFAELLEFAYDDYFA
jgi:hypothetical protein